MHVLVTCKYKKDRIKNNQEKLETRFSQFSLEVTPVLIQSASKHYAAFPHPLVMLDIKFDQDWPTDDLRDEYSSLKMYFFFIQGQVTSK